MKPSGKLEVASLRGKRRDMLRQAILGSLALGGLIAVAAIAPNALQILGMFGGGSKRKIYPSKVKVSLDRLLNKKYNCSMVM